MSSPAQKSDPRYSPPQAYLGVPAVESAGRLRTGPILAGFAAQLGAYLGLAVIISVLFFFAIQRGWFDPEDANAWISHAMAGPERWLFETLGLAIGVFGGYVAGRVARRAEVEHAFVFGACSACLSFLVIGLQETVANALQDPEFLFSLALGVAAACFGGQLAATQRDAEFLDRSG